MEYKKARWETKYDNYKKDKEEVKQKMASIRREQAVLKEGPEYAAKKKELEELKKKSNQYNKIEQNESKIINILEYKKQLSEKNSELLKEKNEITKKEQKLDKINKTIEKVNGQIDQIIAKLNSGKLKEEQKVETHKKLDKYIEEIKSATKNKEKLEEALQKKGKEKLEQEISKNDRLISKCDLIGANLMKGKSMEDIKARLSDFEALPNKDLADKKDKAKQEKQENKGQENKDQENKDQENKDQENKGQDEREDNTPKKITLLDKLKNRFPRIAGFFDKVKDVFKKREESSKDSIKDEVDNNTVEEIQDEITKQTDSKEPKQNSHELGEDDMLMKITEMGEKGFRESVKVSKQERLANMKKQSANEYAQKYGGRYTTQDGAELEQ